MGRGFSFTDPMPGDLHTCHPAMQCSGLTRESDQSEISLPYLDWSYPAFTSQVLIEFKSVDTALLVMNYLLPYTSFPPTNEHCYSIAMLIKKGSDQLHSLVSSVLILTAKKHHAMNTESNHLHSLRITLVRKLQLLPMKWYFVQTSLKRMLSWPIKS